VRLDSKGIEGRKCYRVGSYVRDISSGYLICVVFSDSLLSKPSLVPNGLEPLGEFQHVIDGFPSEQQDD
jgi:hypothetical protein